jgi:hypothetical protein
MSYEEKYLKYKYKYIAIRNKKQTGGTVKCDLTEWTAITNNGQQNCGIFIHKTDPSILMKCNAKMSENVELINSQASIFPKEISECIDDKNRFYLIMERLDGDITSIYFNILPMKVLDKMGLDKHTIQDIKVLFDIKTNTTMMPIIPKNQQENILGTISSTNTEITLKLYDRFIEELKKEWIIYHDIISKEIIKILLKLIELGFNYGDMKFDNFGYKLSDTIISTDFRKGDVPKIFDKYFYVYILDSDSGLNNLLSKNSTFENYLEYNRNLGNGFSLEEINTTISNFKKQINYQNLKKIYENHIITEEKKFKHEKLLDYFNSGFILTVNGQYGLSSMNGIKRGDWNSISKKFDDLPSYYSEEIKNILTKEYNWTYNTYNLRTIEELISFLNKIKCKSCNKLIENDSNFCCNCGIKL